MTSATSQFEDVAIEEIEKRVIVRMWKMSSYGTFSCFMATDGREVKDWSPDLVKVSEKFRTASRHESSSSVALSEFAARLHTAGWRVGMTAREATRLLRVGESS